MFRISLTVLTALAVGTVACGDDGPGDAERFCGEVQANADALLALPEEGGVDDFLGLYRRIGELAPLAIEQDWDALVTNFETAATVDVDDPESEQRAVASAYATERSAIAVHDWLVRNCGVDLGPVATVGPPVVAVPPTTVPGD